jgi:serine protease Do
MGKVWQDEGMTMKQGGRLGVLALVAGTTFSCGLLYAAQQSAASRHLLLAAAIGGRSGHGSQGYLGVELRDVSDDQLGALKLKEARGAEIVNLDHDGPACKVGMRTHDVILQMNGQVIEGEDQLRRMLREIPAGRRVTFLISRDGQTQTVSTLMADRKTVAMQAWEQHYTVPDPAPRSTDYGGRGNGFMTSAPPASSVTQMPKGHRDFLATSMLLSSSFTGAQLELMGPQLAQYFGAESGAGLLVRSVDKNSPAEVAGMKAGDVVVRINSLPVGSDNDWTKTVHANKGRPIPVVVLRDKHEQTLTLTPDGKKRSSLVPTLGLEGFWEQTEQYTRELLAKL